MAYQALWILKVPQAVEKGQHRKIAARTVQVLSESCKLWKSHLQGRPKTLRPKFSCRSQKTWAVPCERQMLLNSVLNPEFSVLQNFHDSSFPAAQLSKQEGLKQATRWTPKGAWNLFAQIQRKDTHNGIYFEPRLSFIKRIIKIKRLRLLQNFLYWNDVPPDLL